MKPRIRPKQTKDRPKRSLAPAGPGFAIDSHRAMILLSLLTLLLKSLIFAPFQWWPSSGWWPLSFVCLVPWLVMIGTARHAPRVYSYSYLLAAAFFLINMRWLYPATGYGYAALSIYLAVYFPLVACPLRHVVRRRRWPLALALPLVWVGSEMLRAVVASGFPWFFLSHSLHGVLTLIQVSDLVGAYGVSFVVAAVNGALADVVLVLWDRLSSRSRDRLVASPSRGRRETPASVNGRHGGRPLLSHIRRARFSVVFAAGLVIGISIYGQIQLHRDTTNEGPRIAVIQGDYIDTAYPERVNAHDRTTSKERMRTYLSMLEAAAKEQPDLYLLPESPWIMCLNPEFRDFDALSRASFAALQNHATRHRAMVVTGSASLIPTPYDILAKERRYNSATVFRPDGLEPKRYDKIHLVYFGEVVPFRFSRLRFLYFWLNWLMPFSGPDGDFEYSLFRGKEFRRFTMEAPSQDGRPYRFAIPICYEDVMPYVSREFVWGGSNEKRVDFLLNISNDGWFGRGIQQPQHLAICVFRAVENRVGVARAVNTGVSGFIEPDGRVHDLVTGDPATPWPGNCGYAVANVGLDSRFTLYSRYGDWFAWGCALMWLVLFVDYWIVRARNGNY